MDFVTFRLRWTDVAPEKRRFEELRASQLVTEFLNNYDRSFTEQFGAHFLESCLDQLLVQHFGVWISGWRSGPDGGPVLTELNPDDPPVRQSLAVMARIREWRSFLESVESLISEYPLSLGRGISRSVQKVAARLIPLALQMTRAQNAWYRTCALALNWYLEAFGIGDRKSRAVVDKTFSAQFSDWKQPPVATQNSVVRQISEAVAETSPLETEDCLERWLQLREPPERQFEYFPESYPPLRGDGHFKYIREVEKDERMLEALRTSRQWARGEEPLTFAVLREWQALLLNDPEVGLRTTDASARRGRERYGVEHLSRFNGKLMEANEPHLRTPWRAALTYLDICNFRPFPDGNTRLARLALDGILLRDGYALNYIEPVFVVARAAEDARGGTLLSLVVSDLMGSLG